MIYSILITGGLAVSMAANFYLKIKSKRLTIRGNILKIKNSMLKDKLTVAERRLADHEMASYLVNGINEKDSLRTQFEKETGKHAVWHEKETKQFKRWDSQRL